jgi:protease-4
LVDELAYAEDVVEELESKGSGPIRLVEAEGRSKSKLEPIGSLSLFSLLAGGKSPKAISGKGEKIAVVYAVGLILPSDGEDLLFPETIVSPGGMNRLLQECLDDPTIRAIVLRVNSPGGDAVASDLIWATTRRIRKQKPIVASMSDVAASGGYYIAMGADRIVAQPGSITGSIGVVGGKLALGGLYEKLGIAALSVSRGRNAAIFSSTTVFSESEREAMRRLLTRTYAGFVSKIAESRGRPLADVEAVAQGRVWTGRQAYRHGLVDELGGLQTAIAMAKELAGLPEDRDVEIVTYPKPMGVMELMQRFLGSETMARAVGPSIAPAGLLPAPFGRGAAFLGLLGQSRTLALMPFVFEIR